MPQYERSAMLEARDITLKQSGKQILFITVPDLPQHARSPLQEGFYNKEMEKNDYKQKG